MPAIAEASRERGKTMRTRNRLCLALLLLAAACGSRDRAAVRRSYISVADSGRAQRPGSAVQFLESEPAANTCKVIGIIGPPEDLFGSFGETVNVLRRIAGEFGADAIFLISEAEGEKWGFGAASGADGASAHGGSSTTHKIRAKAIVWVK